MGNHRGISTNTGKWVYGGFHKHMKTTPAPIGIQMPEYEHLIIASGFSDWNMPKPLQLYAVNPKTVGKNTCLLDQKGNEIFEHDILEIKTATNTFRSIVMFGKYAFNGQHIGFYLSHLHKDDEFMRKDILYYLDNCNCKVIGNVFVNPELITEVRNGNE